MTRGPNGHDANDVIRAHGPDELRRRLDAAHAVTGRRAKLILAWPPRDQTERAQPSAEVGDEIEIARLAAMSPIERDRQMKLVAERLGCKLTTLNAEVRARRADDRDTGAKGRGLSLSDPEPWDSPVDGINLLEELVAAVSEYVILARKEATAIALWILHTFLFEHFTCTPRLAITSPEKRCGKTTLLDVLVCLVPRPLAAANITSAAVFRTIELARPVLLIDECDTFLHGDDGLRGVLNSGHRKGGRVVRVVGDDHEPREFSTHAPVAIALIGRLSGPLGTLADRSIPICLRRRRSNERVRVFRVDRTEHLEILRRMAARWAIDNAEAIRDADPVMPATLFNRDADNWRALLAIADAAGGEWPSWARDVATSLSAGGASDQESLTTTLLADIRAAFTEKAVDRMSTEQLVSFLTAIEGRPWCEWKNGSPITKAWLSRRLTPYGISSGTIELPGGKTLKGFYRSAFNDTFARYLPDESVNPSGGLESGQSREQQNVNSVEPLTLCSARKGLDSGASDGLTDCGDIDCKDAMDAGGGDGTRRP